MTLQRSSSCPRFAALARRITLGAALIAVMGLWGFPWFVDLAMAPLLIGLCCRAPVARLLLLVVSLVLASALAEAGVRILGRQTRHAQPFYRPEEQSLRRSGYVPGVDVEFPMPHGDLVPLDPAQASRIQEARTVRFRTDSRGYRNDSDFPGKPLLVVGDSFVLGSGTSQESILANVLQRELGLPAYAIGLPVSPEWLLRRTAALLETVDPSEPRPTTVLFVFEGNDFNYSTGIADGREPPEPSAYDRVKARWISRLNFRAGSLVFGITRQLLNRVRPTPGGLVEVERIGGQDVGFLGAYIDAALAPKLEFSLPAPVRDTAATLRAVFFIPTKYRVYFASIESQPGRALPEPAPGLGALREQFAPLGVRVVDLTPCLRRAAAEALPQGRYVYWRDDSHWNALGIRAAAGAVAEFLREEPP